MDVRILYSKKWSAYYLAHWSLASEAEVREIVGGRDFYSLYFEMNGQIYFSLVRSSFGAEMMLPVWLHFITEHEGWLFPSKTINQELFLSWLEEEQNFVLTRRIKVKLLIQINGNN